MKRRTSKKQRDIVVVVGSTGSLGKAVVAELQNRGLSLRLLGRSFDSFVKAGFTTNENLDLVVCHGMSDRRAFQKELFEDAKAVICVARPRWAKPGDREAFVPMIQNLSDAVCTNQVPHMIMHGLPYVDAYAFGLTRTMEIVREAEREARSRFETTTTASSRLCITRVTEMSETGHLLEVARMTRVWLCMWGYDPCMQPISSKDYAAALAGLIVGGESAQWKSEVLLGGPEVITWRQLGSMIESAIGRRLFVIVLPLFILKVMVHALHYAGMVFFCLDGVANVLKLISIPMTANATSSKQGRIGVDRVEDYLREHAKPGEAKDVRNRILGSSHKKEQPASKITG